MKNTPMVCITWYDAKDGQTGWHSVEDIKNESLATCYSVGWLVRKTDERTVIMSDYSKVDNDEDGKTDCEDPDCLKDKRIQQRCRMLTRHQPTKVKSRK